MKDHRKPMPLNVTDVASIDVLLAIGRTLEFALQEVKPGIEFALIGSRNSCMLVSSHMSNGISGIFSVLYENDATPLTWEAVLPFLMSRVPLGWGSPANHQARKIISDPETKTLFELEFMAGAP